VESKRQGAGEWGPKQKKQQLAGSRQVSDHLGWHCYSLRDLPVNISSSLRTQANWKLLSKLEFKCHPTFTSLPLWSLSPLHYFI
jgi:hypothetical protein